MQGRSGCFHDDDGFWKKRREELFWPEHKLCLKDIPPPYTLEKTRIFSLNKKAFMC